MIKTFIFYMRYKSLQLLFIVYGYHNCNNKFNFV